MFWRKETGKFSKKVNAENCKKRKFLKQTLSHSFQNAFFLSNFVFSSKNVTSLESKLPIGPGKCFKIYNPLRHTHSFCSLTHQSPDSTFLWFWSLKKKKKKDGLDISAFIACVYREDPSTCLSAQCSVTDIRGDNSYKKKEDLLEHRRLGWKSCYAAL